MLNIRIFPTPDTQGSQVIAVVADLPARLSELLALPVAKGHGDYLCAWLVGNGATESEVWLFKDKDDRVAFTKLAHMAASGLKFIQGFETNRIRDRAGALVH